MGVASPLTILCVWLGRFTYAYPEAKNAIECCNHYHENIWPPQGRIRVWRESSSQFRVQCSFGAINKEGRCQCPVNHTALKLDAPGQRDPSLPSEISTGLTCVPNAQESYMKYMPEIDAPSKSYTIEEALELSIGPGRFTEYTKQQERRGKGSINNFHHSHRYVYNSQAGSIAENLGVVCAFTNPNGHYFPPGLWRKNKMQLILYKEDPVLQQSIKVVESNLNHEIFARTWRRAEKVVVKCVISGSLTGYLTAKLFSWSTLPFNEKPIYPKTQFTLGFGHRAALETVESDSIQLRL